MDGLYDVHHPVPGHSRLARQFEARGTQSRCQYKQSIGRRSWPRGARPQELCPAGLGLFRLRLPGGLHHPLIFLPSSRDIGHRQLYRPCCLWALIGFLQPSSALWLRAYSRPALLQRPCRWFWIYSRDALVAVTAFLLLARRPAFSVVDLRHSSWACSALHRAANQCAGGHHVRAPAISACSAAFLFLFSYTRSARSSSSGSAAISLRYLRQLRSGLGGWGVALSGCFARRSALAD